MKKTVIFLTLAVMAVVGVWAQVNQVSVGQKAKIARCHKVVMECVKSGTDSTETFTIISQPKVFGIEGCAIYIKGGDDNYSIKKIRDIESATAGILYVKGNEKNSFVYSSIEYDTLSKYKKSIQTIHLSTPAGAAQKKAFYKVETVSFYDDGGNPILEGYLPRAQKAEEDNLLTLFMQNLYYDEGKSPSPGAK